MDFFTIDGTPIPIAEGGATERILRAGGLSRMWLGNLRNGIRWEVSTHQVRTSLLTNAEAMQIRRLVAGGREVTCAGSIIDPAGGTLACRVLVTDGSVVTTQATDDGSHTMRTLTLEIHPVNEPLLFAYVPRRSIADATYSRASTATYRTEAGLLTPAAAGELRNRHYVRNPVTGLYERSTLIEGSRTNLVPYSHGATGWGGAAVGTSNAAVAPDGTMTATRVSGIAAAAGERYSVSVLGGTNISGRTFVGGLWVKGEGADIGKSVGVYIKRQAGATFVGSPMLDVVLTGDWQRITPDAFTGAADSTGVSLGLSRGATLADSCLIWGGQVEEAPFASSDIITTGAAVNRAADSLSFPFAHAPQEMTLYTKVIERGTGLGGTASLRLFHLGSAAGARLLVYSGSGNRYRLEYGDGVAAITDAATLPPVAIGDLVESRVTLSAAGGVTFAQSLNGGPESLSAVAGARPLPGAWGEPTLYLNRWPGASNVGFNAFLAVKVAPGLKSLDQMRLLPPVS